VAEANRQLRSANDELSQLYRQISALMEHADQKLRNAQGADPRSGPSEQPIAPDDMLARVGHLITRHLEIGDQLRQAQKMEAVGRLAGGVAHDFNNLLTVITGNAEFLRDHFSAQTVPFELGEIERAVARASALTSKLLTFSRKQVMQPRVIDINSVVSGMEDLLRRLIGEDIQLVTVLASALGRIKAHPSQIEQVVMNLAVNARDAMPKGGRVVIETRNVVLAACQIGSLPAGSYVGLSLSDTGHGMDAEKGQALVRAVLHHQGAR
jgi:two-component system cell cycle sensor histidine kinase/response regulator CckA